MRLWAARCAFTRAIAALITWADTDPSMAGYEVAMGEGLVAVTDAADGDHDGPHRAGGAHYTGLGLDLLVYNTIGVFIADGAHPAYSRLGEKWRRLHPLARWGGDFGDPDHYSFVWEGRS
jgi:hypothetical protein